MKKSILTVLAIITALLMSAQAPSIGKNTEPSKKEAKAKAKKEKKAKVKKVKETDEDYFFRKGKGTVYLFGVSQMLTDSLVFMTNIQQVDSIDIDKKTTTLPFRTELSTQFKEYLEEKRYARKQTSCVFFDSNRKKLSKKFYKIKKRYLDDSTAKIIIIDDEKFHFIHPLDGYMNE